MDKWIVIGFVHVVLVTLFIKIISWKLIHWAKGYCWMCYGSAFDGNRHFCIRGCFGGYPLPCVCEYIKKKWNFEKSLVIKNVHWIICIVLVLYLGISYEIVESIWVRFGKLIEEHFYMFGVWLFAIVVYCSFVISRSIMLFYHILGRIALLDISDKNHVAQIMSPCPGEEQHGFGENHCITMYIKDNEEKGRVDDEISK